MYIIFLKINVFYVHSHSSTNKKPKPFSKWNVNRKANELQRYASHHSGDWMAEFHPVYFFWPSFWRSPTGWPCTGSSSLWDQTQRTSHICSGPPDSSGKPSSQWCPQASPPVRAERKPLKTSASIPHIDIMHLF